MDIISETSRLVLTEYGRYRLRYQLFKDRSEREGGSGSGYGICICQTEAGNGELFDFCRVSGVTDDMGTARLLFDSMVKGLVMPVSLCDLIHDWQSACMMI